MLSSQNLSSLAPVEHLDVTASPHKRLIHLIFFGILLITTIALQYNRNYLSTERIFGSGVIQSHFTDVSPTRSLSAENSTPNALQKFKNVLITSHGRSGSTMVGTFFSTAKWKYYFEPLREEWIHLDEPTEEPETSQNLSDDEPVAWTCSKVLPNQCSASVIMELRDLFNCIQSNLPTEMFKYELTRDDVYGSSKKRDTFRENREKSSNVVNIVTESGLLNSDGIYDGLQYPSANCTDVSGVAIKTIRMVGRLQDIYDTFEYLDHQIDLVVQLVRDPRAVLASRFNVMWGEPFARTYESTYKWAEEICIPTMQDYFAGITHKNYMLLRYEDVLISSETEATEIWSRLGELIPKPIVDLTRQYDGCVNGTEEEINDCNLKLLQMSEAASMYNTTPRDRLEQIDKWKRTLFYDEVKAIQDACGDLYRLIYPDIYETFGACD